MIARLVEKEFNPFLIFSEGIKRDYWKEMD